MHGGEQQHNRSSIVGSPPDVLRVDRAGISSTPSIILRVEGRRLREDSREALGPVAPDAMEELRSARISAGMSTRHTSVACLT